MQGTLEHCPPPPFPYKSPLPPWHWVGGSGENKAELKSLARRDPASSRHCEQSRPLDLLGRIFPVKQEPRLAVTGRCTRAVPPPGAGPTGWGTRITAPVLVEEVRTSFPLIGNLSPGCKMGSWTVERPCPRGSVHPRGQGLAEGTGQERSVLPTPPASGPQVFDAGEMFGIMQVEEAEEEESEDEAAQEARKKPNPGGELCYKVIVTNENGLQAADPNR